MAHYIKQVPAWLSAESLFLRNSQPCPLAVFMWMHISGALAQPIPQS